VQCRSRHRFRRAIGFTAAALVVVGCSTLAGLDELHPAVDPQDGSQVDTGGDAEPSGRDGAISPEVDATIDGGRARDATDDVDATRNPMSPPPSDGGQDAGVDGRDDELCRLAGKCPCTTNAECPSTHTCCNGRCDDVTSAPLNCGSCGRACTDGRTCIQGECSCGDLDPLCAAVCVDFFSDSNNCGACGHSCLGGECIGRTCQPVLLASQQDGTVAVAVAGDGVFFANDKGNTVGRISRFGPPCTASTCTLLANPFLKVPCALAANASGVYVANCGDDASLERKKEDGAIARLDVNLTSVTSLAEAEHARTIALSGDRVVWASASDKNVVATVASNSSDAGAVKPLAIASDGHTLVTALAADAQSVVFGVAPRSSSAPSGLPAGIYHALIGAPPCVDETCRPIVPLTASPQGFALSDGWLYWTSADGLIRKIVKTGGCGGIAPCPVVIAEGQVDPRGIVVAGKLAYWVNTGDGTVRNSSIYKKCRGPMCQAIAGRLGSAVALTQDADALYIATRGNGPSTGAVWKLAK
jgi:hypothetical protein